MARQGRRKVTVLTVRPVFEPSRLAPACLADVYERVLPRRRRATRADRTSRHPGSEDSPRQMGGTAR